MQSSQTRNHRATLKVLIGHLWPKQQLSLRIRVVFSVICLIGAKVVNVYTPILYKDAVNALSEIPSEIVFPVAIILSYGLAKILTSFFAELRDFLFIRVSQHAQRSLALNTFKHLHNLSLAFHLNRQTGGLSRVIERALRGIQFFLSFMLFNILPTLMELCFVLGILFYYFDYRYPAITVITIITYISFTLSITEWRLKFRKKMNAKDSEANTKAIDSLLNFETVKYFTNADFEYQRYDKSLAGYESAAIESQRSLSFLNVGQASIIGCGTLSMMYIAAAGVMEGKHSIGDFVLANTYMMQLFMPLNLLGFVYREMKQGLIDMEKMFELLNVSPEIQDEPNAVNLEIANETVEFREVNFSYDQERQILKKINFKIEPGQTVALVGPSGSGKSTISKLLFRFYDPQQGQILINDIDISKVTQQSVRESIGIVPQDTVLFNDTIGYNIHYGNQKAAWEKVLHASDLAQLTTFIKKLPKGFETMVGERGLKLSGGEKQRVAIARTILKNPKILVFDEATSALDTKTEQEIQSALEDVSRGRTTLIIAHRLSTVQKADKILVLQDGEIKESGNHNELLQQKGLYQQMWQLQQEKEQQHPPLAVS